MRVFISSTIYDFRDLRSAIQLWLEESGYEVLMSEHNDFPQQPDENSYLSCLKAIESCDTFILLIGHRVGGWYSEPDRVSITRKEYRKAFELMLQGRIKIIPFIRRDLWTIREDRKAIARAMKENEILEKELPADQKLAILNARSGFANSADDIFQFINEVTQAGKMREATKEAKALPKGNWVYTFSSFREVVDALRVCLNLKGNIRRKEATANVLDELRDNFKYLFEKRNGRVFSKLSWAAKVRSLFSGIWDESITVTMEELGSFAFFGFNLPVTIGTLKADRLRAAIASGVFLDFDRETESLVVGPLQRQLLEILGRIEALKNLLAGDDLKKLPEAITKLVQSRKTTFPNLILMHSMFAYDGIEDLQNRIFNVHKFLRGDSETLVIAAPIRTIPFFDETKRTANEKLDDTDVRKLLQQR